MKRLILAFIILSAITSAFAQKRVWLNNKYEWTSDSSKAMRYAIIFPEDNGIIQVEEFTLEGVKKDIWHFSQYKSSPRKRIREGLHTTLYANGQDSLTEVYSNNRREGQVMVYYPDGSIHFAENYKNGHLEGKFQQYYSNGKLRREEYYSENKCTGGKLFAEDGSELEHQPYTIYPSFPGGIENLMKLMANVIKYPEAAWKKRVEGRVILQFVVNEEGKMTHPEVIQSVRYDIDAESLRAFNAIADVYRWSHGYQDGEVKRVKFTIPLYFKIPK